MHKWTCVNFKPLWSMLSANCQNWLLCSLIFSQMVRRKRDLCSSADYAYRNDRLAYAGGQLAIGSAAYDWRPTASSGNTSHLAPLIVNAHVVWHEWTLAAAASQCVPRRSSAAWFVAERSGS